MTNEAFDILAYSQSPKTSKRTTFQDELEAALTVRARKTTSILYSENLYEDGDDFLDNLLKSRKNRSDAFKASKNKNRINDFDFSDDDEKQETKKRTSFLKSMKRISVDEDTIAPQREHNTTNSCLLSSEDIQYKNDAVKLASRSPTKDNTIKSPLSLSRDSPLDFPLPFHSSISPAPIRPESRAESRDTGCEDRLRASLDADLKCVKTSGIEKETPRPKPRQRTLGLNIHATEKTETSPSAPLATNISNTTDISAPERITRRSSSHHLTDECRAESSDSNSLTLGDTKDLRRTYSKSLKESIEEPGEHTVAQVTQVQSKSDIRTSSSQSQRPNTKKVESKYLGTLKILDCKVSQDCQPQAADSLRATVYQEWLRKKKEKSSENLHKEKILQEEKKKREEEQKKDAAASYEAWKEKKDMMLKAKSKENKHRMRKEQKAVEEVEEKKIAAEKVFYQWKHKHDELLREKYRQQRETERKLALKKQEEEEERKRDSKSAFSNWCEMKTDARYKKVSSEHQDKNKAEEHRYIQEEKDKMAIEMFEQWLAKKDIQQKRQREERRIQVILRESPPPPWSPPNKTIQFRK
ncbi:microtubule-associated protein 9 [Festucalex cinctus]